MLIFVILNSDYRDRYIHLDTCTWILIYIEWSIFYIKQYSIHKGSPLLLSLNPITILLSQTSAKILIRFLESIYVLMFLYLCSSESESCSIVSHSLQPYGLYSHWNSLGQNTGMYKDNNLVLLAYILF